ncbi:MAG: hypothetical protein GY793_11245, partial [Proteobacteria bacterium]|nr:hypothetical protein [Pseudomonadota bacterium]
MIKFKSLGVKISVFSALTIIFCLAIGVYFQSSKAYEITRDLTIQKAKELGKYHAEEVSKVFDRNSTYAVTMVNSFRALKVAGIKDRNTYNNIIKHILVDNKEIESLWACYEPNTLDGRDSEFKNDKFAYNSASTGRYATYYYSFDGELVESNLSSLEKTSETDEAYDYYTIPLRTNKATFIDPIFYPDIGKNG